MKLYNIQEETIKAMQLRDALGIWNACGTGKTITALVGVKGRGKTLVLTPLAVTGHWGREGARLGIRYSIYRGKDIDEQASVVITNYEQMYKLKKMIMDKYFTNIIIDESTKIKDVKTNRFKFLRAIKDGGYIQRWYLLTGTPVTNHILDAWTQIYLLDSGYSMGRSYYGFRSRYFSNPDGKNWYWKPTEEAKKIVSQALDLNGIRYQLSDIDINIDTIETVYNYELEKEQENIYRKVLNDYVVELKNGTVNAKTAGIVASKLMQILSGFVYYTQTMGEEKAEILSQSKIETLKELLEQLTGHKVVVFTKFIEEMNMIKKALNPDTTLYYSADTKGVIDEFVNNKDKTTLVANIQSLGYGVNLQVSDAMVYYSIPYSAEQWEQSKSRVCRIGGSNKVLIYYLCAVGQRVGYIDGRALSILNKRRDAKDEIINMMMEEANNVSFREFN